jgi:hypothetical protein
MLGEAVPDRAAPSGEPSEIIAGLERAYDAVIRLAAGEEFRMSIPTRPEDHDILIAGAISDALDYLRATPAEPGASPPNDVRGAIALATGYMSLATGEEVLAAQRILVRYLRELAARSPAPAGDAPTCSECHGSGRTDSHVTGEVECSHCDGCGEDPAGDAPTAVVVAQGPVNADRIDWTNTAGDAPREDALRERDRMWSKAILAEGAEAINRITTRLLVLRAAVSPSPGTRAASEGEA